MMGKQVWLLIGTSGGAQTSIGVDRDVVMTLDRKGFAKLYRNTVYGSKRKDALAWADKQIEERRAAIEGGRVIRVDSVKELREALQ
jgi:hypothetical protein